MGSVSFVACGKTSLRLGVLVLCLILATGAVAAQQRVAHKKAAPSPVFTADAVNAVIDAPVLRPGASGAAVIQAQVLLDRARFSPGEIDGRFRDNMRRALTAFQRARGIAPSGAVDGPTWSALRADGVPPLVPYTITDADTTGPFASIPADMMERAKLDGLPYRNAGEAIGEKFHVDPNLLRMLNPGKPVEPGVEIAVPNVTDTANVRRAAKIVLDKKDRVLRALDREDVLLAQFPISLGGPKDVLPRGRYKVVSEVRNPVFYYDPAKIRTAKKGDAKAKIAPGPNNPVGVMWLGLSKPHYGLHGSPEPSKVGHEETSGCIHLTNWDIVRLAAMTSPGTPVEVLD